ncbi:hypothetical protein CSB37_04015 [bacterium DOLZORAL124_38_8]|nr:MAG: hypothetical protein CSB37_04015 [bacterium DOLZORAL124_38_8]
MNNSKFSVTKRVAIGKIIGLVFAGLFLAFFAYAGLEISVRNNFVWGVLLLFMLMGALTGFMGQVTKHPLFKFAQPWWFRGAVIGGFCMLILVLLAYDSFLPVMQTSFVAWTGLESPFWSVLDGMFIGMVMEYFETRFGGEGEGLPLV